MKINSGRDSKNLTIEQRVKSRQTLSHNIVYILNTAAMTITKFI